MQKIFNNTTISSAVKTDFHVYCRTRPPTESPKLSQKDTDVAIKVIKEKGEIVINNTPSIQNGPSI